MHLHGQGRWCRPQEAAGWLEQPRPWLETQWPGLSPRECRDAWSRQARPGEAQEPSSGSVPKGGRLAVLARGRKV